MIPHSKPHVDSKDIQAVAAQVKSGFHAYGKKCKEFEKELAKLTKQKYCRSVNSGATALHLALKSLDVKKGDEVIIPAYVCQTLLHAVNQVGAKVKFADVARGLPVISYDTIKPLVTKKTKAIIVPHIFGVKADVNKIAKLKIPIVEDLAQGLGITPSKKSAICIYSFYACKIISTGHGGALTTNSKKLYDKILDLTKFDGREKYAPAFNVDFTDIQAALGLNQLKKLKGFIRKRKEIAKIYNKEFSSLPMALPNYKGGFPYRYHILLPTKKDRNKLHKHLKQKNIDASTTPVYKPLYQYFKYKKYFPNTETRQDQTLSIPLYPALKDKEINHIIKVMKDYYAT